MSIMKDAISAMRDVVLLNEKIKNVSDELKTHSLLLQEHDRDIVQIKTIMSVQSRPPNSRLP